jgi:hypothetical protein
MMSPRVTCPVTCSNALTYLPPLLFPLPPVCIIITDDTKTAIENWNIFTIGTERFFDLSATLY